MAKAQAVMCERKKIVVHVCRVKVNNQAGQPVQRFDRQPYVDTPLSFTTEELKSYLNGVFKNQANVEITDVIDDGLTDATDLPSAGKPNGDGALCINNGEAVPLIAELNDNAGHRAIFIFTQRYAWSRLGVQTVKTVRGFTPRDAKFCVVKHGAAPGLAVLAHELGHTLGLVHHFSYLEGVMDFSGRANSA